MFIGGAITFIGKAITFISKGSSAIGKSFKISKAKITDNIKVNRHNLRRRLIIYKLKSLLVLINSLISVFDYFIRLSL
jgi:hypothetical protein